ncbi:MAG: tripartite tricarboxylate transporter permease [Saccharofermentanales bacterium]|jgi:putative tricarboxylic transport membrane protein
MLEVLQTLIDPINLLMMNIGVAAGIIIGALPGLSVILAIALLLPLTFGMDSIAGMYLLLGAYCGGTYGGSITAILINTPGTPAASATMFDGYKLAQKGRAGDALKAALVASTIGGVISCFALIFIAPPLASMALKFGPPEYFALCLFGLTIVVSISSKNLLRGLISGGLGLLLSTVGIDATEGIPRFMFGNQQLLSGIKPVIVMLGMFAVSEMMEKSRSVIERTQISTDFSKATMKIKDILIHWKVILKSSIIGVIIGAIPGTGGAISAFFSYNEAKRTSKHPELFGTGVIEGVIAPESGNNAVTGATLIPLLTLGIPGDTAVAVLMGALTMQGITPGPDLFTSGRYWVNSIMVGLLIINIFMLLQGTLFIRAFANVARVPFSVLVPCIMVLCTLGAFAVVNTTFDIFLMLVFGFVGYLLKRFDFPIPPLTIALVLGELTENNLRRSMILSKGDISIFFTRPIALLFMAIAAFSLFFPILRDALKSHKAKSKKD